MNHRVTSTKNFHSIDTTHDGMPQMIVRSLICLKNERADDGFCVWCVQQDFQCFHCNVPRPCTNAEQNWRNASWCEKRVTHAVIPTEECPFHLVNVFNGMLIQLPQTIGGGFSPGNRFEGQFLGWPENCECCANLAMTSP